MKVFILSQNSQRIHFFESIMHVFVICFSNPLVVYYILDIVGWWLTLFLIIMFSMQTKGVLKCHFFLVLSFYGPQINNHINCLCFCVTYCHYWICLMRFLHCNQHGPWSVFLNNFITAFPISESRVTLSRCNTGMQRYVVSYSSVMRCDEYTTPGI